MSLRSPLSRVLGAGSAREGTDHWWMQRVTAIALLILGLWFLVSIRGGDHGESDMIAWVANPLNAVMLLLLAVMLTWHSMLGVQVVIEDYVHSEGLKLATLLVVKFAVIVLGASAVFAVLKIAI